MTNDEIPGQIDPQDFLLIRLTPEMREFFDCLKELCILKGLDYKAAKSYNSNTVEVYIHGRGISKNP